MALPQLQKHRLNVLAGSQRIDREIRAGAIILKESQAANGHFIGPPASRLDTVISIRPGFGPSQNLQRSRRGPLPPLGDLLFNQHRSDPSSRAYNMAAIMSQSTEQPSSSPRRQNLVDLIADVLTGCSTIHSLCQAVCRTRYVDAELLR